MEAILTKKSQEKKERNDKIISAYKELIIVKGSQRVAVAEKVARQLGFNYSLVMRVTQGMKIK